MLRIVCAWCTPLRVLDGCGPLKTGDEISHSICQACEDRENSNLFTVERTRRGESRKKNLQNPRE